MVQESGAGASGSGCPRSGLKTGPCRISTSGRSSAAPGGRNRRLVPADGCGMGNPPRDAGRVIAQASAARPSGSGGLGGLDILRGRFFSAGQANEELGAAFGLVATGDVTPVVLNDTVDGAEAEAGAPANRLGGVEGIENPLRVAQARTRIGEAQPGFAVLTPGGNFEQSAARFGERVHGVLNDFDENLEDLVGVGQHAGKICFQRKPNLNLSGGAARLEQVRRALEENADVDEGLLPGGLLGKAEKVGDQIAGAARLVDDLAQQAVLLVGESLAGPELLRAGHDRVEGMVDFLGGAGDKIAKRGEFFFLHELRLQLPLAVVGPA